jgi:hypothetical protein
VGDDRRVADEVQKVLVDFLVAELRLAAQERGRQPVHLLGLRRHVALGVDIHVEAAPGGQVVLDLQAGQFDQLVAEVGLEACGFGIENDLTRHETYFGWFELRFNPAPCRELA